MVEPRRFDIVLRGYDRTQVDHHVAGLVEENATLRHRLSAAERRRQVAEQHAVATEDEIRILQSRQRGSPPQESIGVRVQKLLRLAEHEAADVRAKAAREASTLVEQARADAERHREQAEAAAESLRLRATQDARRLRDQARQEVDGLVTVQNDIRTRLARLSDLLGEEIGRLGGPPGHAAEATGPTPIPPQQRRGPADDDRDRHREPLRTVGHSGA